MELDSINEIREKRDEIRERIKELNLEDFNDQTYGDEDEYTFKGLVGGIEAMLTDISTLTKHPSKFVRISTYNERNTIHSQLSRIEIYLKNPGQYISSFEGLKTLLRSFNVRSFSERQVEFESEIQEVRKIKLQLQQVLLNSKQLNLNIEESNEGFNEKQLKTNKKLEEIEGELETIIERKEELIEQSENLEAINVKLESIKESATDNLTNIESSLSESRSNERLINSFANKVIEREERLEDLEHRTEENGKRLSDYEQERVTILKKAENLIDSAKKALNYTTAQGISASFQTQYENSNNKWIFGSWIFGAVVCLIGALGLGMWILRTNPDSLGILIGRISLLPLPIIGTFFCANQYTKQKNIIEDYAYKMVLSKAIVGFSEELKKNGTEGNEEYVHYIKTALEEIHRDPLRKRAEAKNGETKSTSLNDLVDMAERIVKMTKLD